MNVGKLTVFFTTKQTFLMSRSTRWHGTVPHKRLTLRLFWTFFEIEKSWKVAHYCRLRIRLVHSSPLSKVLLCDSSPVHSMNANSKTHFTDDSTVDSLHGRLNPGHPKFKDTYLELFSLPKLSRVTVNFMAISGPISIIRSPRKKKHFLTGGRCEWWKLDHLSPWNFTVHRLNFGRPESSEYVLFTSPLNFEWPGFNRLFLLKAV
jgi:hypothetical protein